VSGPSGATPNFVCQDRHLESKIKWLEINGALFRSRTLDLPHLSASQRAPSRFTNVRKFAKTRKQETLLSRFLSIIYDWHSDCSNKL
jgi:hypothetical protein